MLVELAIVEAVGALHFLLRHVCGQVVGTNGGGEIFVALEEAFNATPLHGASRVLDAHLGHHTVLALEHLKSWLLLKLLLINYLLIY